MDPWLKLVGPGSYNLPSIFSPQARAGSPHGGGPKISFTRSSKQLTEVSAMPGAGTYNPTMSPRVPLAPAFSLGSSPKEDKYWNRKLYERSPGPVYHYSTNQEIASSAKQSKVVFLQHHPLATTLSRQARSHDQQRDPAS